MLTNVAFDVPGEPQGKGRARATRTGRMYTPAKTVAYESLVALSAAQAMAGHALLEGPLAVEIEAVHSIPASWSKKRRDDALGKPATCKPDIDNIAKAVADGGNGVVWADDKQIARLWASKTYGERPCVWVRVATI